MLPKWKLSIRNIAERAAGVVDRVDMGAELDDDDAADLVLAGFYGGDTASVIAAMMPAIRPAGAALERHGHPDTRVTVALS